MDWLPPDQKNHYYRYPMTTEPSDVRQFIRSAQQFLAPSQELYHLLHQISYNEPFAKKLKETAALSKPEVVANLIKSVGIQSPIKVDYNPDGITVIFQSPNVNVCFSIKLALCW